MFSVHTTQEEFLKKRYNHRSFCIWVWEKLGQGNHVIIVTSSSFSKCFPSTRKRRVGVFQFLRFEEHFRKVPFSWRLSVDERSNRRNNQIKLRFRISPAWWRSGLILGKPCVSSYRNFFTSLLNWVSLDFHNAAPCLEQFLFFNRRFLQLLKLQREIQGKCEMLLS